MPAVSQKRSSIVVTQHSISQSILRLEHAPTFGIFVDREGAGNFVQDRFEYRASASPGHAGLRMIYRGCNTAFTVSRKRLRPLQRFSAGETPDGVEHGLMSVAEILPQYRYKCR
jgi:hypothetical protein